MDFFIPGALKNYANGRVHWRTEAAYRKRWRTAVRLLLRGPFAVCPPALPKRVWLTASTFNRYDDDGLRNACKPILDGLVDAGVLHSDAPDAGHDVIYDQMIDRKNRGVKIMVEPRR